MSFGVIYVAVILLLMLFALMREMLRQVKDSRVVIESAESEIV